MPEHGPVDPVKGLVATLNQSGLSKSNNAAYQTILGLIRGLESTDRATQTFISSGGGGGTGTQVIKASTTVLTNAQILALPTTPFVLLAAPPANIRYVPIVTDVYGTTVTGFGNIDPDSSMLIEYSSGKVWSNFLGNDSVLTFTYLSDCIGVATDYDFQFVAQMQVEPIYGWGNIINPGIQHSAGDSIRIRIGNNGMGNLTGGNVNNFMSLTTYYGQVPVI